MASCLEVNNVPYRRIPVEMNSLSSPRYPLSYHAFSCLETPKVSGVIVLLETENIFVFLKGTTDPEKYSPLLQILLSAPRPIGLWYINTQFTEPKPCTAPWPAQNLGGQRSSCPFPVFSQDEAKLIPTYKKLIITWE